MSKPLSTCAVHIEDCEGWWLSGCCGSVAEHWRLKPEVSWVRLPATAGFFTFLYFRVITSKFIYKSAVAEHAWQNHHPIDWEETTVLDRGKGQELLLKEALHIQMTPSEERFNRDEGLEVSGCWIAVMRRQGGRSNPHRPLTSDDVYPQ